jgi:hypothetical protein
MNSKHVLHNREGYFETMDRLTFSQTMAASTVVLALIYIIHELIQSLGTGVTPCLSLAHEQPDESAQLERDGTDWPPTRVIRGTDSYSFSHGAGD